MGDADEKSLTFLFWCVYVCVCVECVLCVCVCVSMCMQQGLGIEYKEGTMREMRDAGSGVIRWREKEACEIF